MAIIFLTRIKRSYPGLSPKTTSAKPKLSQAIGWRLTEVLEQA